MEDDDYIREAREQYASEDIEVDVDAVVSNADDGAWVAAWVWVANTKDD